MEMAIPVDQVPGAKQPIAHGHVWRANLFRWDFPKGKRGRAAAFSPPIVSDFHALSKFGKIRFSDPKQKSTKTLPISRPLPTPANPRPATLMPKGGLAPADAVKLGKSPEKK